DGAAGPDRLLVLWRPHRAGEHRPTRRASRGRRVLPLHWRPSATQARAPATNTSGAGGLAVVVARAVPRRVRALLDGGRLRRVWLCRRPRRDRRAVPAAPGLLLS